MSKTHFVLAGSKREPNHKAVKVSAVDPDEIMEVTVDLRGPKLPDANEIPEKAWSHKELEEKFGASKKDADAVQKSLKKYKLKIERVSLLTRSITVSGKASQMEAAFQPKLATFRSEEQGDYVGRESTIKIPMELKGIVRGVFGLDQRIMARRKRPKSRAKTGGGSLSPLTPSDLEQRYNFPPGDGAGQSIFIAEFGGAYVEEDLQDFAKKFNLPKTNVQWVSVNAPAYEIGQLASLPPMERKQRMGEAMEVTMDVQIIAGLCPRANISVLFATFDENGWVQLLNKVIESNPVAVSVSWGLAEEDSGWSVGALNSINDRLNAVRLLGITACISSGDDGSGDGLNDGSAHVDFPGSSPFTLSVGGTMLIETGKDVKEVTWWESPGERTKNGGGSSGGGVSTMFDRPAWQNVTVQSLNAKSIAGRVVPDVSTLAGEPLYDLFFNGQPFPDGGTSASAPLWAALIARVNAQLPASKQQRFLTPLLYSNGADGQPVGKDAFRDIIQGNNASYPSPGKGYIAKAGYDAVTGWGVPDGVKLVNALMNV